LSLVPTKSREKHSAESVQFGAAIVVFKSFNEYFRFPYCLKGFGGTIRQVQGFGLYR
jgi:hypothetical protein